MRAAIVFLGILVSNAVLETRDLSFSDETKVGLIFAVAILFVMDIWEWAVYVFGKKE